MSGVPNWSVFLGLIALTQLPIHGGLSTSTAASPYLSATTLFPNYEKMLSTFKIYIYTLQDSSSSSSKFSKQPTLSLFHNSLLNSPFLTKKPDQAHAFYIPFPPDVSARSSARVVRELRISHPYWNRTLGADHFFLAPSGIDYSGDRNAVELKKNAVQISVFPTTSGNFIPHKDITLPPLTQSPLALIERPANTTPSYLGFMIWDEKMEPSLVKAMEGDADFRIELDPSDHVDLVKSSKFCLFAHGGDVTWMVEAMAMGCVPVVIVGRPTQDLPLMDVLRWSEMAFLVGSRGGAGRLKALLKGVDEDRYQRMRESGVTASRHLVWNLEPQPHDAFHMVMYQLWLRRHAIRYARRESI